MLLCVLRAFADADARKQELQLREDRILLKEAELASLEHSTKAGLKTAQKKVSPSFTKFPAHLPAMQHICECSRQTGCMQQRMS